MNVRAVVLVVSVLALAGPGELRAQAAPSVPAVAQVGETVRIRTSDWLYTGVLARVRQDTATIRFSVDSVHVPRAAVQRVEIQRGRRRSTGRVVAATAIGITAGLLVGGYLGVLAECGTSCSDDPEFAGIAGMLLGSATGVLVGGATGLTIGLRMRTPRWVPGVLPESAP